ncbi:alpha/beta fold hydrolase [Bradyrhizobium sp. ORS 86]|uniref:alpha/beta fold hydrolase n=1 Tax=Bradyrhizobium sp. ORS 86 TaxID=1685970 RepID=UPI00389019A0
MIALSPMQGGRTPGTQARSDDDVLAFPISPAQKRIWLAHDDQPAYNASFRWALTGRLDLPVLQRCFNDIVARHEALRATFARIDGELHQLISSSLRLLIPVTDLSSLPTSDRDTEVERMCLAEATRPFNLEKGPLIRVGLLHIAEEQYVLMLTLHHIICDGWSIGVIMRELRTLYSALSEGKPPTLAPLPIQFPDYVIWSAERARSSREQELAYWTSKLQGYRPFRLQPDRQVSGNRTNDGAIVSRLLPKDLTDAVRAFSERYSGTMFSTTLAACVAVLHRHSKATDIAVWTPLAGRNLAELEGLIGLLVNQVAIRLDASGDPRFAELAARARDNVWELLAHQDLPFETVVEALDEDDKPPEGPFCFVNFVCQRAFGGAVHSEFDFPSVRVRPIPSISPGALYDLNFFLVEREDGWRLSLEYNTNLYTPATAARLVDDFDHTLRAVVSNHDIRLSGLPGPTNDEAPTLGSGSSNSVLGPVAPSLPIEDDPDICTLPASVSQLRFWRLSRLRPDSSAFNMPASIRIGGSLSVPLLQESLNILAARHEILRTTFNESSGELLQVISSHETFPLQHSDLQNASELDDFNLDNVLRDEAHVPFDLERGPLARARLFRLGPQDHVLIVTLHHIISDGWSQSILQRELWASYEALAERREPDLLPMAIQYADFAVWQNDWLTSQEAVQHLAYWMKSLAGPLPVLDFPTDHIPGQRPDVRGAVERVQLPDQLIQRLKSRGRSANVTMYMLTLAAFAVLLERYTSQHDLTIGSPSANRNSQTEPVIGPFSGPIALRLNLADDPTLNEVLKQAGQVTMDALDHAVYPFESMMERLKMRSVRGRNPLFQFYFLYQTAFLQHREAAGLAIAPIPTVSVGNPFELQLAIIERGHDVWLNLEYDRGLFEPGSVLNILSYYTHILEQIAADPEQRISALRLPPGARDSARSVSEEIRPRDFLAPRNAVETQLATIWEALFDLPQVGIRDDFFELGGHSLLAASLISRIETEFGTKIDLSLLLVDRTIEQLAEAIMGVDGSRRSSLIPLRASGTKTPLFCVHGGGGHVLGYEELAKALPSDQPVYGLASPELDGVQRAMTVAELARFYNSEIRRIQPQGPYQLCGYSFGGYVALEMAAQLIAQGEDVPVLVMLDTGNSGYYRHLPFNQWTRFWSVRIADRIWRYYRRLADHKIDVALSSAFFFVRKNVRLRLWTLAQRVFRVANRPMPVQLRDNLTMFKATARSYEPRPLQARIILFRVDGRDPEYSLNESLGWELVAQKGVDVHHVPGDHLSFMRQPIVGRVAEQLQPYLT